MKNFRVGQEGYFVSINWSEYKMPVYGKIAKLKETRDGLYGVIKDEQDNNRLIKLA